MDERWENNLERTYYLTYICNGKRISERERNRSLILLAEPEKKDYMISDNKQKAIEDFVNAHVKGNEDVFLVEVKILPGNNIKVFLDADNGITIDKCIKVNRALYNRIEESDLFSNGDFSLEVSSPGIDEPLKLHRQYKKNIGRTIEVMLNDGTKKEGKLVGVNDDDLPAEEAGIIIEEKTGHGKKMLITTTNILFNQVKHTKVQVTF